MKIHTPDELCKWAAGRCAAKEYCRTEMIQKLCQKGLTKDEAENVTEKLVAKNFINEERYAKAFTHDKICYNHWGKNKVLFMLQQKGIDQQTAEAALAEVDEEEYKTMLLSLLQEKVKSIRAKTDYERAQKLLRFAAGRGFEAEKVFEVVEQL